MMQNINRKFMKNILDIKIDVGDLIIQRVAAEDIPYILSWINDKSLYKYWGQEIKDYERDAILLEQKFNDNKNPRLGIRDKKSNNIIGEILLYDKQSDEITIGYRIEKKMQGQKIMSRCLEAFIESLFCNTNLNSIKAMVDVRNISSWKILEKVGFKRTETINQGLMVETVCDFYIYKITRKK